MMWIKVLIARRLPLLTQLLHFMSGKFWRSNHALWLNVQKQQHFIVEMLWKIFKERGDALWHKQLIVGSAKQFKLPHNHHHHHWRYKHRESGNCHRKEFPWDFFHTFSYLSFCIVFFAVDTFNSLRTCRC